MIISGTLPCVPCVSELEKQLCWLGQGQLGSPAPQQEPLLCCFFSSPALLQAGAHPVLVQSRNHKAKSWTGCGMGMGRHSVVSMHRGCTRDCLAALPQEGSWGKLLLLCLCTVTLERKWEVTITAVALPCSPSLGRDVALVAVS